MMLVALLLKFCPLLVIHKKKFLKLGHKDQNFRFLPQV